MAQQVSQPQSYKIRLANLKILKVNKEPKIMHHNCLFTLMIFEQIALFIFVFLTLFTLLKMEVYFINCLFTLKFFYLLFTFIIFGNIYFHQQLCLLSSVCLL